MRLLLASVSLAALCACSTPTIYTKTVEVRRDADGRVLETTVTETMQQPSRSAKDIDMDNMDKRGKVRQPPQ